jgi:hypothetical protein
MFPLIYVLLFTAMVLHSDHYMYWTFAKQQNSGGHILLLHIKGVMVTSKSDGKCKNCMKGFYI